MPEVLRPVRRNEPCPCGSGLRYKDCHGKLTAEGPSVESLLARALPLHREGRIDAANLLYVKVLQAEPGNAIAHHYLGMIAWQRGDRAAGERLMRESIAADARVADFHGNLGLLLRDTGRTEEAIACHRQALEVDPGYIEAYNNLGLALEDLGRWDEALEAYRAAIAREPGFAAARQNLGRTLVLLGRYAEGWEEYRWRLLAQGLATTPPSPAEARLAPDLSERRYLLLAEQGIGDVIFFLRFAPELVRRGAALGFSGDARLHGMLARTGLFALGLHAEGAAIDAQPLFIGDLPWLLEANDPAHFPPPLALTPLPNRLARWQVSLLSLGSAQRVALTWRGGVASAGPARTQVKEIALARLAEQLRGREATWLAIQRHPRPGECEELARLLGQPVNDFTAANDDLEDMLALLALVDDYVGVSNANAHLRAGVGGSMEVLIPGPPEWRWGVGETSPWFPGMQLRRLGASAHAISGSDPISEK